MRPLFSNDVHSELSPRARRLASVFFYLGRRPYPGKEGGRRVRIPSGVLIATPAPTSFLLLFRREFHSCRWLKQKRPYLGGTTYWKIQFGLVSTALYAGESTASSGHVPAGSSGPNHRPQRPQCGGPSSPGKNNKQGLGNLFIAFFKQRVQVADSVERDARVAETFGQAGEEDLGEEARGDLMRSVLYAVEKGKLHDGLVHCAGTPDCGRGGFSYKSVHERGASAFEERSWDIRPRQFFQ